MGRRVGLAADVKDRLRRRDDRLEDNAGSGSAGGVEALDHAAAILGNLVEGRFSVKMLAASDETRFPRFSCS